MKPTEAWGPHVYYEAPVTTPDIESDPYFAVAQSLRFTVMFGMPAIPSDNKSDIADMHVVRSVSARLLAKAADPRAFHQFALERGNKEAVSESIRLYTLAHLQSYLSYTGLLHAREIEKISRPNWGVIPTYFYDLPEQPEPPDYQQVRDQIENWLEDGYMIGVYQGAFDEPTPSHLMNATSCYYWAQRRGIKMQLIWVFDNDRLIKRKGMERPRYNITSRRKSVQGLWNAPLTVESRVTDVTDSYQYIREYLDLGAYFVFVTEEEKDHAARRWTASQAYAELITIPYMEGVPTSSDIVKLRSKYFSAIK